MQFNLLPKHTYRKPFYRRLEYPPSLLNIFERLVYLPFLKSVSLTLSSLHTLGRFKSNNLKLEGFWDAHVVLARKTLRLGSKGVVSSGTFTYSSGNILQMLSAQFVGVH